MSSVRISDKKGVIRDPVLCQSCLPVWLSMPVAASDMRLGKWQVAWSPARVSFLLGARVKVTLEGLGMCGIRKEVISRGFLYVSVPHVSQSVRRKSQNTTGREGPRRACSALGLSTCWCFLSLWAYSSGVRSTAWLSIQRPVKILKNSENIKEHINISLAFLWILISHSCWKGSCHIT